MNTQNELFSHLPLSAAFTGYRISKLPFEPTSENINRLKAKLKEAVNTLYLKGFRTFYSGMCNGVDIWAAEAVLEFKKEFPDTALICAVPFEGHSDKLKGDELEAYRRITDNALRVDILKGRITYRETARAFNERNKYMVDNSDALIAVCNKDSLTPGGTANTVKMAQKKGIDIIFVNPEKI